MAVASRRSETVSQHCTQRSLTKRDVRETVIEFARHLRVAGVRIARCRRRTAANRRAAAAASLLLAAMVRGFFWLGGRHCECRSDMVRFWKKPLLFSARAYVCTGAGGRAKTSQP